MSGDHRSTAPGSSSQWFVLWGAVFTLTGFAAWYGAVSSSQAAPPLAIDAAALNVGSQWVQERFKWTVPVKNVSSQSIKVSGVQTSCSCVDVRPKSFSISANSTENLTFTLDLTANVKWDAPEFLFNQEFELSLGEGSSVAMQSFRLKGMIQCPLLVSKSTRVSAATWRLTPAPLGATAWSVPIKATRPLKNLRVRTGSTAASASVRRDSADSQDWILDLRLVSSERRYTDISVILQPDAMNDETQLPEVAWTFRTEVVSPFQIIPEEVDFGVVARNTIVKQRVTLRRSDGKPCLVSDLRTPPGIGASVLETADTGTVSIDVEAEFQTAGLQQTVIEVAVGESDSDPETLRIPVRAYVKSQSSVESSKP